MNLADAQSRINALFGYTPTEAELLARPDLIDIAIEAVRANAVNVSQVLTALNTFFDASYTADDLKQRVDLLKLGMAILAADNAGGVGGGSGKLLQTQFTHLTSTSSQSVPVNTSTNITGMSCSITPTSANSKIFVQARWTGASELGSISGNASPIGLSWQLKRGSTVIGTPEGSRFERAYINTFDLNITSGLGYYHHTNLWYLDSPNTTSELTYSLAAFMATDAAIFYTNRSELPLDDDNVGSTSSIMLWEIAP